MQKLEELVGQRVKSWGRTLSEGEFTLLTDLCWAVAPLHTDGEAMKKSKFGERILGASLVLAVVQSLAATCGVRNLMLQCDWKMVAVVGYEHVRFTGALKPGDTVWVDTEFTELRPTSKETRKVLALKQMAFNQRDEKLLECLQLVLFEKP